MSSPDLTASSSTAALAPGVFARDRELGAELVHLGEVEAQRDFRLQPQCGFEQFRGDVGVAVAVAADPCAHAQERRHAQAVDALLQIGVELRDLAQEGRAIIAQRVLDLVAYGEARLAQQLGLPQLRDAGAQLRFVLRQRLLRALMLARGEKREDRMFGVEQAPAPHFGRMRGEDRRDRAARQNARDLAGADARLAQMREGARKAWRRGRADLLAGGFGAGALLQRMEVFGDVLEMEEIAESPDDGERLLGGQAAQQQIELAVGLDVALAARRDREAADRLDALESLRTFMLAHGFAEEPPEQADVLMQRVAFWRFARGRGRGVGGRDERAVFGVHGDP